MTEYFIRVGGQTQGAYSKEQLFEMHRRRGLPGATLSWKAGEDGWTPLSKRWVPPLSIANRAAGFAMFGILVGLLLCILLFGAGMLPGAMALSHEPVLFASLLAGALVVAVVANLAYAFFIRQRLGHFSLGAVTGMLLCGSSAIFVATVSVDVFQLGDMLAESGDAEIHYLPEEAAITIDGEIGPRFLADFTRQLDSHPEARTIRINSPGGLVDEALQAAARIEERHMVLRVDGICASACAAMFAAAPIRQATARSVFGLHQARILNLQSEVAVALRIHDSDDELDRLMRAAGFNEELVERRRLTPPEDMHWIAAVPLVLGGVEATITDSDGHALEPDMARLLHVRVQLGEGAYAGLIDAFLPHAREALAGQIPALYDAVVRDDVVAWEQAKALMSGTMQSYALEHATDQAVIDMMRRRHEWLTASDGMPDPAYCKVLNGNALPAGSELAEATSEYLWEIERLARSIPASEPRARRIRDPHDRRIVEAFMSANRRRLAADKHYSRSYGEWSAAQRCELLAAMYGAAETLSPRQQAELVRMAEGRPPGTMSEPLTPS